MCKVGFIMFKKNLNLFVLASKFIRVKKGKAETD